MKTISNPVELARQAATEFHACYGDDCVSIIVYGSAAGGDFNPKTSDINLLVILKDASLTALERSEAIQEKWLRQRFSRPLFMDTDYMERSLDTFPIEFSNMKGCYQVLAGKDVLEGLEIRKKDVIYQLERELKGKRLHLLQQWLNVKKKPRLIEDLIIVSLRDFTASFRALLYIKDREIPRDRMELFAAVGKEYDLENRPFARTLEALRSKDRKRMAAIFPEYAEAIRQLVEIIDKQN
jgi:predicted nucleotidyltransferase